MSVTNTDIVFDFIKLYLLTRQPGDSVRIHTPGRTSELIANKILRLVYFDFIILYLLVGFIIQYLPCARFVAFGRRLDFLKCPGRILRIMAENCRLILTKFAFR